MTLIPPSELIINSDGSIYHLQLRPDELAQTIITVGDQDRVEAVSRYFDSVEIRRQHREFLTHTGWLSGKRISVLSTGIGTDNIDIVFNEVDALFNIDFNTREAKAEKTSVEFVRIGTSGTFRREIPIDALLVSEAAVGLDNLMHFYQHTCPQEWLAFYASFLQTWQTSGIRTIPYLCDSRSPLVDAKIDGLIRGITVTAPGFYAPQGRNLRAASHHQFLKDMLVPFEFEGRYFTNLEMETAAMYGLANALGHRAVSFNAILANRITGEFSQQAGSTVDRLIQAVLAQL